MLYSQKGNIRPIFQSLHTQDAVCEVFLIYHEPLEIADCSATRVPKACKLYYYPLHHKLEPGYI